jgi:serine/threonine protein kinase
MSKMISEGTYGSIFYPSINLCNEDATTENEKYITKIQKSANSHDEITIGEIIKTIPFYSHFFSPIETSCIVSPKSINYEIVKKSKIMQNDFHELDTEHSYTSSKIRYVGKYTIDQYIKTLEDDAKNKKIYNTHLHLLDALDKLLEKNIIHFDLKPDNIMFDEIQSIPIIIDFGLSQVITPLLENANPEVVKHFFVDYNVYEYWCVDIHIMSNIAHEKIFYRDSLVKKNHLDRLLQDFKTPFYNYFFTREELRGFERDFTIYFSKYVNNYTWNELFNELLTYYKTWDNYSLSMSYLYVIKDNRKVHDNYKNLLKTNLLAMPNKRMTTEEFRNQLKQLL